MKKQSTKEGIVLNRMYAGSYLSSNLGHEVINMYQADNGKYYLYLNHHGAFAKEHEGKIKKMILVKYHSEGVVEVVGIAKISQDVFTPLTPQEKGVVSDGEILPKQKKFIDNNDIKYGSKSITEIFKESDYQNVFITYEAEKIWRRKSDNRLFIYFSKAKSTPNEAIVVNAKQAKTSLKQYFYNDDKDFEILNKIFEEVENENEKEKLWELVEKVKIESDGENHKLSLFDIYQIQNNENCFSNALAYFMTRPEYYELWRNFFYEQCRISLNENFSVKREVDAKIEDKNWDHNNYPSGGRIDLLISDKENIVVIENKIKSDINKVETDGKECTQLNRYVNYVNWAADKIPNKLFLILTPKYNIPTISTEMDGEYNIITYADLYDYLKNNQSVFSDDANFNAFFEAMKRHTYENVNDYLYYEMQKKFFRRILE